MDLKGVLSISGKPGLFKLVSQTKGGLIVEAFEDKKRMPVFSAHQISALEEISIYTQTADIALKDVFKKMYDLLEGGEVMSAKSEKKDMMDFFAKILPDYDDEKVYQSDVKKLFQWYNILLKNNYMIFESEEIPSDEVESSVETEVKIDEPKKAPKKTTKKPKAE